MTYQLGRQLSVDDLDRWLGGDKASVPMTTAVLETLAGRRGDVAAWAKKTLVARKKP